MKKFVATVLAAALVISTLTGSAFAASDDNKPKVTGLGLLPIVAGPAAAAALFPTTSTLAWATTKTLYFKFNFWTWKWYEVPYCHGAWCKKKYVKVNHQSKSSSVGKAVVGCIMGSALGAITAAIRKGNALGNPLRWRSQAEHEMIVKSGVEKKFELTNEEAQIALSLCGLGSFALHWQQQAPAAVKARF